MANFKKSNIKKKTERSNDPQMSRHQEKRIKKNKPELKKITPVQPVKVKGITIAAAATALLGFISPRLGFCSFISMLLAGTCIYRIYKHRNIFFWLNVLALVLALISGCYWMMTIGAQLMKL